MRSQESRESISTALRRLSLGMSMALAASAQLQKDVADTCGISTAYLSKILSGRKNPSQLILEKYAAAVGHSIGEIYDLGDQALEREAETLRRAAVRRAVQERAVTALVEAAQHLDDQGLEELIGTLERLRSERDAMSA